MYSEVHLNRVLYKPAPVASSRFRQIVVVEKEQFEVRIFEGAVVQLDPEFIANCSDAEVVFHPTLQSAREDVNKEFQDSISAGWQPYTGSHG
jgi:hypothetical protein